MSESNNEFSFNPIMQIIKFIDRIQRKHELYVYLT